MIEYFRVIYSNEVDKFFDTLDDKSREKIIYNIDKAKFTLDPKLFKKLNNDIWEFRTKYKKTQFRLLAFWDKRDKQDILVIATHGFIKKAQKVAQSELDKAIRIKEIYFKINSDENKEYTYLLSYREKRN
ncbi:type II toxin-antitoxin system RelE/ParE family toxin [Bacteroidota bacterium]